MFGSNYTPERTSAIAGILSCCILVDELAVSGDADNEIANFYTKAFLNTDSHASNEILRPSPYLEPGLTLLANIENLGTDQQSARRASYAFQIIQLTQNLVKRPDLLQQLSEEIPRISAQGSSEDQLMSIGEFYEQSVSTLSYRIQVKGTQGYLRQPLIAQKIRGILFCSIRFALLWRQQGGSKFDFIIRKRNIANSAQNILDQSL